MDRPPAGGRRSRRLAGRGAGELTEIARLVDAGRLRPIVSRTPPLTEAWEAYEQVQEWVRRVERVEALDATAKRLTRWSAAQSARSVEVVLTNGEQESRSPGAVALLDQAG